MPRPLRNVVQRNRIFHFRRAIPHDLRLLFGQSELTCSLRTSELRAAEFRSRQLYIASQTLFIESRRHIMLSDDQLALIVQDFYAYVLDQENQWRLRLSAIPEEARLRRAEHFKKVATRGRTDLARNVLENVYFIALVMMRKHNLVETLDNDKKNQLRQALLRGGIDLAEAVCRCLQQRL